LRATSRITGCSINTVTKLLVEVGRACEQFHNESVKNLSTKRVQMDEIWSFVYAKPKNLPKEMEGIAGDVWTWTALDADSKLIISWLVGDRSKHSAYSIVRDLKGRISTDRIQVNTVGYGPYKEVVSDVFFGNVDHATVIKHFGTDKSSPSERYGSMECIGVEKNVIVGSPSMKHATTSHVERQNLTMRMGMRRFTRATNAFSKKMENHWLAIALHFVYYNFVRVHKTLRITPAMEAGLRKRPMTIEEIVMLAENKKGA
jgi:IS1 family transposase